MSLAQVVSRFDMEVERPGSPTAKTQIDFEPENPEQATDGSRVDASDSRARSLSVHDSVKADQELNTETITSLPESQTGHLSSQALQIPYSRSTIGVGSPTRDYNLSHACSVIESPVLQEEEVTKQQTSPTGQDKYVEKDINNGSGDSQTSYLPPAYLNTVWGGPPAELDNIKRSLNNTTIKGSFTESVVSFVWMYGFPQ
jgi:hypothetical protein